MVVKRLFRCLHINIGFRREERIEKMPSVHIVIVRNLGTAPPAAGRVFGDFRIIGENILPKRRLFFIALKAFGCFYRGFKARLKAGDRRRLVDRAGEDFRRHRPDEMTGAVSIALHGRSVEFDELLEKRINLL